MFVLFAVALLNTSGPAHEIVVLIAYAQKPPVNALVDVSNRARSIFSDFLSTSKLCACSTMRQVPSHVLVHTDPFHEILVLIIVNS